MTGRVFDRRTATANPARSNADTVPVHRNGAGAGRHVMRSSGSVIYLTGVTFAANWASTHSPSTRMTSVPHFTPSISLSTRNPRS